MALDRRFRNYDYSAKGSTHKDPRGTRSFGNPPRVSVCSLPRLPPTAAYSLRTVLLFSRQVQKRAERLILPFLEEYQKLGIDTLILSGYPHLEEAYRTAELPFDYLPVESPDWPTSRFSSRLQSGEMMASALPPVNKRPFFEKQISYWVARISLRSLVISTPAQSTTACTGAEGLRMRMQT
jgi:hypothetical protein